MKKALVMFAHLDGDGDGNLTEVCFHILPNPIKAKEQGKELRGLYSYT